MNEELNNLLSEAIEEEEYNPLTSEAVDLAITISNLDELINQEQRHVA